METEPEKQLVEPKQLINQKYLELLDEYFPTRESEDMYKYDMRMYRATGKFPSTELVNELVKQSEQVPEWKLKEFNARFHYIKKEDSEFYTLDKPNSCKQYISRHEKEKHIGYYRRNAIYNDDGTCLARLAYTLTTYHYYNAEYIFAGTVGEIIIQLPSQLTDSDMKFYYTVHDQDIMNIPNCHCATIHFYEII